MAKQKKQYSCTACQATFRKWAGQCPDCREWNTLEESVVEEAQRSGFRKVGYSGSPVEVQAIADVEVDSVNRISTGLDELDRVLGGGVVPGSVVLLGGDPGVGKSTALLQVCCLLEEEKSLYVTGEESLHQVALRAKRVGLVGTNVVLAADTLVENICATALQEKPAILVVDSIQTMQMAEIQSAPGSVTQVRESAAYLTQFAKQYNIAVFLVGHVTKSGGLAGPRVLEHIIDVVCYFEGGGDSRYRLMRAIKNRYGAVNELGVFAMGERGLKEVKNPSAIFLSRGDTPSPGSAVMVVWEGTRPMLVEIQALVDTSYADFPRRISVGYDQNRLTMELAVLHKHGGVATYNQDVFINVVGGVKVTETSVDLAVLLAIVSSLEERTLPADLVIFGEVGLSGEIRPVPNGQERLKEAAKHGFKQAIVPKANMPNSRFSGMTIIPASKITDALQALR